MKKSLTLLRITVHRLARYMYKRPNNVPVDLRACDICPGFFANENHIIMTWSKFDGPPDELLDVMSKIFLNFDSVSDEHTLYITIKLKDAELIYCFRKCVDKYVRIGGSL